MYLAPLNYDRFFKKIFSDDDIAKRFLEDLLETKIETIERLKSRHTITDDATYIEFDFRCKIDGAFIIIDMQQWFKADLVQRFYLYHALNTGLQLETLPKRKIVIDATTQKIKKVKDYRLLDPVFTIVWMVEDTMRFENEDYVSYLMTPELVLDFVRNEKLWKTNDIQMIMNERAQVMQSISNKYHEIAFWKKSTGLSFSKNIVT
ncbi:MAG: hypothetical protein OMM_07325, partial [Candidatus Magnetoglobus multicellularis str. Araruama]